MCHWLLLSIVTSSLEPEKEETKSVGLQKQEMKHKKTYYRPKQQFMSFGPCCGHCGCLLAVLTPYFHPVSSCSQWWLGCYCGGGLDCVISKCCESINKVI
jgi:hypothetical protein